jgi:hypothetical protein
VEREQMEVPLLKAEQGLETKSNWKKSNQILIITVHNEASCETNKKVWAYESHGTFQTQSFN